MEKDVNKCEMCGITAKTLYSAHNKEHLKLCEKCFKYHEKNSGKPVMGKDFNISF